MTVLTEIPLEFESYLRDKTLQKLPTSLNEFIFAYIPNLDLSVDIDRNSTIPNENLIVHRAPVASVGKTGENAIVYSAIIDSTVEEFTFNAIYLHDKNEGNSCGMIIHQQDETKQQAMTITKSALMQYDSAAASANVTIDAETWQVDISDLFAACSKVGHTHTLAEVGGSNPNLFINGDFSVNQKFGFSGASIDVGSHEYFADKWQLTTSSGQVTGLDVQHHSNNRGTYIRIASKSHAGVAGFRQFVEVTDDLMKIQGRQVTVQAEFESDMVGEVYIRASFLHISKGTLIPGTHGVDSDAVTIKTSETNNAAITLTLPTITETTVKSSDVAIEFAFYFRKSASDRNTPDGHVTVFNCKAEWGIVATRLESDSISVNRLNCQRYSVRIQAQQYSMLGVGCIESTGVSEAGSVIFSLAIPTSMRKAPALTGTRLTLLLKNGRTASSESFRPHSIVVVNNSCILTMKGTTTAFQRNEIVQVQVAGGSELDVFLDAEI